MHTLQGRKSHATSNLGFPIGPVDTTLDMRLKSRIVVQVNGPGAIETAAADIAQPRCEAQAQ